MKRSTQRPVFAIGLAASVAVHAAVLAFGAIKVPLASTPEIRLVRPAAPLPAASPEREDPPRVVVIRPPGALPSGGSEGARGGDAAAGLRPPPAGAKVPDGPPAVPAPMRASEPRTRLALATPLAEGGLPVLQVARDSAATSPAARPGRGIILRTGPASTGTGGGRVSGAGGAGGLGGLAGGGGVASAGPGGDCITPGIAGRDVPGRGPSALPGRTGAPGGRSGRPGGSSRGPGGRPGG